MYLSLSKVLQLDVQPPETHNQHILVHGGHQTHRTWLRTLKAAHPTVLFLTKSFQSVENCPPYIVEKTETKLLGAVGVVVRTQI